MRKNILFLFAVSLFLVSCGPKINSEQQKSLSILTAKVDSIAKSVNAYDSLALMQLTDDFFERKNFLQKQMVDTLTPAVIFKLDSFIQLRKAMGFIREDFPTIKYEANTMQQQLIDLNHDVENRLVEEKQFERYYSLEKANFDELELATKQLEEVVERCKSGYAEKIESIDQIIAAYKAKANE